MGWLPDGAIAVAFCSIAFSLPGAMRNRTGPGVRRVVFLFAASSLACGATHALAVWSLWHPVYQLDRIIRIVTAILSVSTAVVALRLAPAFHTIALPELARANQSLREEIEARDAASEARLRSYFEAAPQGVVAVSPQGRIVLLNRRMEEMTGYTSAELLGKHLSMLVPERLREGFVPLTSQDGSGPWERIIRRKDGSEFTAEAGHGEVAAGTETIAFCLINDITEHKHARDEIVRINSELRRSNEELEQFAYVASHDLQEPLRMITGYLQVLERRYGGKLDADARDFIHYAVDGATRMRSLINGVLGFSRAGTKSADLRLVFAGQIVDHALLNLTTAVEESRAEVTVDQLPSVVTDPALLTQVFQNLIGNAIKFQKDQIPRVHVSAVRQDGSWVFAVRDNGVGIDQEHADRIFRIFERLHGGEQYPGTGVGLAISKKIVERLGGRIWVESKPGEGSTFYFSIPASV
jgi:PAS domain S-box-containing protein